MRRRPVQKCDCRPFPRPRRTFIVYVLEEEYDEQSDSDPLDGDRDSVQAVEATEERERRFVSPFFEDDGLCGTCHQGRTYGCVCDEGRDQDDEVVEDKDDPA